MCVGMLHCSHRQDVFCAVHSSCCRAPLSSLRGPRWLAGAARSLVRQHLLHVLSRVLDVGDLQIPLVHHHLQQRGRRRGQLQAGAARSGVSFVVLWVTGGAPHPALLPVPLRRCGAPHPPTPRAPTRHPLPPTFRASGVRNAGALGPMRMFLTLRCSRASRMMTACSRVGTGKGQVRGWTAGSRWEQVGTGGGGHYHIF